MDMVFSLIRALVRAGGTGGIPPVNFGQWVAATRQIRQQWQGTLQFSAFLYISTHSLLPIHPSFETHGEGPVNCRVLKNCAVIVIPCAALKTESLFSLVLSLFYMGGDQNDPPWLIIVR